MCACVCALMARETGRGGEIKGIPHVYMRVLALFALFFPRLGIGHVSALACIKTNASSTCKCACMYLNAIQKLALRYMLAI